MPSILIVTAVDKLQGAIVRAIASLQNTPGIYVSLNKTQKSAELMLTQNKCRTDKLFFIDCMTSEKTRDDVLHISPSQLDMLATAIEAFITEIKGEKYLVIDAISTLLIYNDENRVAQFVKQMTELASKNQVNIIAFSPETKGEELLNKIFNFFDRVERN
jgi:archaellum biogenesis ATPase FlaH